MAAEVELDVGEVPLLVHVPVYAMYARHIVVHYERLVLDRSLETLQTAPSHVSTKRGQRLFRAMTEVQATD